jgi:hypothetical protein
MTNLLHIGAWQEGPGGKPGVNLDDKFGHPFIADSQGEEGRVERADT